MSNLGHKFLLIVILIVIGFPAGSVHAQTAVDAGPVYIVQEGDSIWDIAYRFHVSQQDLVNANAIVDINQIAVGIHLVIPGLEGLQGVLTTETLSFGETLSSLSLRYQLPIETLVRLNHLTSPNELYAGYSLVLLQQDSIPKPSQRAILEKGESLLELAILNNTDTWSLLAQNQLEISTQVLPSDVIRVPGSQDDGPGGLPGSISSINLTGLKQGRTAEIQISGLESLSVSGTLMDHTLNFFSMPGIGVVALQGVHAMAKPGLYPLNLTIVTPSGTTFTFSQNTLISSGNFTNDIPLFVDPATLDPDTTLPEDKQWMSLASGVSPEKLWQGIFSIPVEPVFAECYTSRFGSRRSYNGSDYIYFHTGLDYCGQIGDPIYAAAPGVVVFAGQLTVRGNATMIDHGHGIFSAYMHQSEILVNVGEHVEQGQLIGRVGNTGRVEGPHLHFEILVGAVQVNPVEWLAQAFP